MTGKPAGVGKFLRVLPFLLAPIAVGLLAMFRIGGPSSDDLSLSNTLYMLKYYGVMAYPVHGNFDAMVVHPPLLYYLHGLFYILTDNIIYSISATHFLVSALTCGIVYQLKIPTNWKLAYIISMILVMTTGQSEVSIRPLLPLSMMWVTGWLSIDAARQNAWQKAPLLFGSVLIGLASVSHYSAAFSAAGLLVYIVLVYLDKDCRQRNEIAAYLLLPATLIVAIYLLTNVFPNIHAVLHGISGAPTTDSIVDNVRNHHLLFGLVPPSILAFLILIIQPPLRWIGIAALPIWVFTLFFVYQKYDYMYTELWLLYFGLLVLILRKFPRLSWVLIALLVMSTIQSRILPSHLASNPGPMKIVRVCAKDLNGSTAKVASRMDLWYISGGQHWLNIIPDLYWKDTVTNQAAHEYFKHFDVVADHRHMSSNTENYNGKTIGNWYLDSVLQLKSFFINRHPRFRSDLNMLFFMVNEKNHQVKGYTLTIDGLYKHSTSESGNYLFISSITTYEIAQKIMLAHPLIPLEYQSIGFSKTQALHIGKEIMNDVLFYGVLHKDTAESIFTKYPPVIIIDSLRMSRVLVDIDSLVAKEIAEESPIKFYRNFNDWTAGTFAY